MRFALLIAVAPLSPAMALGQSADSAAIVRFHDAATAHIAQLTAEPVPGGDTLLTWGKQGPVLFHIVDARADMIRSSMLRNDRIVGQAVSEWRHARPVRYTVKWTSADSSPIERRIVSETKRLTVAGSADTVVAIPDGPWAIADYGMDEHLVPVFESVAPGGATRSISIFRPYGLRWDTVTVTAHEHMGARLLRVNRATDEVSLIVIDAERRLVYVERGDGSSERRPLEGTALYGASLALIAGVKTR